MAEIVPVKRKSRVLVPSSLACLSKLPTINLTAGCSHGCIYCYTKGYSSYPGQGKINFYENTLELLKAELPSKKVKPYAVYFSPSSDVFQPLREIRELSYLVFQYLLKQGVGIAFLSKGEIPGAHMLLIKDHAENIHARVGLISTNKETLRTFEPGATDPERRLSQIREMSEAGIKTQVRLDPIIPGVTDDYETLHRVFDAASKSGVKEAAAATLFMRPIISGSLKRNLNDTTLRNSILSRYDRGDVISMKGEASKVTALPKEKRTEIQRRVESIAREYDIRVKLCACKNPDLASGSCSIAGDWIEPPKGPAQISLFDEHEKS